MRISDWSSDVCSSDLNEGEPGQQAGLRKGDIVVAVGSLDKPSAGAMVAEIQKNAGKALAITVLRGKEPVTLTVPPTEHPQADGSVIGRIGVENGRASCRERVVRYV